MYPKKGKDLIAGYADSIGIPEEDLKEIIEYYYSTLRESLKNLEYLKIRVEGLGAFRIRRTKLLEELEGRCENTINSDWAALETKRIYKNVLERAKVIRKLIEKDRREKELIMQLKLEYKVDKANGIQWTREQTVSKREALLGNTGNRHKQRKSGKKK